jgi:hypothetical protein
MNIITSLKPNEVFVFGSNLAGIHGAGAALFAKEHFGAQQGVGLGPTGQSYAIPTKDERLQTLPLAEIQKYVWYFQNYASIHQTVRFLVTPIGCGLAGYTPAQIAPLFKMWQPNVILPEEFR